MRQNFRACSISDWARAGIAPHRDDSDNRPAPQIPATVLDLDFMVRSAPPKSKWLKTDYDSVPQSSNFSDRCANLGVPQGWIAEVKRSTPICESADDYVELQRWMFEKLKRREVLPDVPTVGDFVPGYEASSWLGFGAPSHR